MVPNPITDAVRITTVLVFHRFVRETPCSQFPADSSLATPKVEGSGLKFQSAGVLGVNLNNYAQKQLTCFQVNIMVAIFKVV